MKTIAGLFRSRADAERAAQRLAALGISREQITILSPGARDRVREAVPTDEGEPQGTGAAIGGFEAGKTGTTENSGARLRSTLARSGKKRR